MIKFCAKSNYGAEFRTTLIQRWQFDFAANARRAIVPFTRERARPRTIFLFAPFTSVTLSCLRRFSIRGHSSCAVVLIESYVGLLDIWHRIRPIHMLCYCRDLHWAGRKIFLGRVCVFGKSYGDATSRQAQWHGIIYVCLLSTLATLPYYSCMFIFFCGAYSAIGWFTEWFTSIFIRFKSH